MARKRRQKNKSKLSRWIYVIIAVFIALIGFSRTDFLENDNNIALTDGNIAVHFVDVGQGSCTVIQSGNDAVLIDAGEREYSSVVLSFFEENGITHLSYVIATHPHSDHIGAMSAVLEKMGADEIFMPYIKDEYEPTSKTYLGLLTTLDEKNIKTEFLESNKTVDFKGVTIDILVSVEQVRSFNNMSLITKITSGKMTALVLADAENKEINSVMKANQNFDFSAHIVALGHHGSNTSLNTNLLSKTGIQIGIISCGEGNSYGHPHAEVTDYLKNNAIEYYRTDLVGNISIITDGEKFSIKTERDAA